MTVAVTVAIIIPTCDGPAILTLDVILLSKPTRRYPPGRVTHILDELRISAAQVNR